MSGGHSEFMRLGRHQLGETGFRSGSEEFTDRGRYVIGRLGDYRVDGVLDRDRVPGLEAHFRGRPPRCIGGDRDAGRLAHLSVLHGVEQEVERHHLCQRSGIAGRVGILAEENSAGLGIHDDRRVRRIVAAGSGRAGAHDECQDDNEPNPRGSGWN